MSHTIAYKLRVSDTDTDTGADIECNYPLSGEAGSAFAYRQSIDGSYATATVDEAIGLGEIATAKAALLLASKEITLDLDGEDITLTADKPFFALNLNFSALKVSNASGSTATLKGFIWGD